MTMSRLGLNLPNLISLGRLLLVPLAISLILEGSYAAAFWVFVIAGVSDAADGFIAKRFDRRTRLGALLDPLADKVLLVSVYLTLGVAGQLWTWLVVLVVLSIAVAMTTVGSGMAYLFRWARILARSEEAL